MNGANVQYSVTTIIGGTPSENFIYFYSFFLFKNLEFDKLNIYPSILFFANKITVFFSGSFTVFQH